MGTIIHRAKSGRLIVKLSREARTGVFIFDGEGKRLGKIVELIGPVRAPYASVSLSTTRLGRGGDPAFVEG